MANSNNLLINFQQIQNLYHTGNITTAYAELQKYLELNKTDTKALKFAQKLKKELQTVSIRKIKESIHKFDHLKKEKKYPELLQAYLEIQKYAPNYEPLNKEIQALYKKVQSNSNTQFKNAFSKLKDVINQYINEEKYNEAISLLVASIQKNPTNILLRKYLIDTKREIIDIKLKTNKNNLQSHDIPKVFSFIKSLYQFEPTYPKIQKLVIQHQKLLQKYNDQQRFLYKRDSELQIQVLYNKKEFEKCFKACNELLRTSISSKVAIKYRKKAQSAIIGENFKSAYKLLKEHMHTCQ